MDLSERVQVFLNTKDLPQEIISYSTPYNIQLI